MALQNYLEPNMGEQAIRTPNMTTQPENMNPTTNILQPQQLAMATDTIVSERAADNTIRSGLSRQAQVQAASQNKEKIIRGKDSPGFFDGVVSTLQSIGQGTMDFAKTDKGNKLITLLAGAAGGAIAGQGTIGGEAGAWIGGNQGVAVNKYNDAQKLEQDKMAIEKEKMNMERAKFKLSVKELEAKLKEAGVKAPTSAQITAATFGQRLVQAEDVFADLENKGYDLAGGVQRRLEEKLPRGARSAELQRKEQAERNFVNAVLRRESGAAIAPSEFESASEQYFPKPGDRPETLEQKRRNRELAIAGLKTEASTAWVPVSQAFSATASAGNEGRTQVAKAGVGDTAYADDRSGAARAWATKNPNDPRAKQILAKLGG